MAMKTTSIRATGSVGSVGNVLTNIPVVVPRKGKIRRVRADVTAGTAINQVQCQVRETAAGAGFTTILAYALAAEPLDSEENVLYVAEDIAGDHIHGTLYVAVAADNVTADHAIAISLDIDVLQ